MIRPLTLVSLIVAAGAGLHLYQVKHSVSLLDRELREVNRQTEVVRERTQILRAEWALLNEPDRLRQVAQRHLALEPMAPAQFIREAELERRLPAARPFAGPPSLFGPPELPPSVPEALMVPSPVAATSAGGTAASLERGHGAAAGTATHAAAGAAKGDTCAACCARRTAAARSGDIGAGWRQRGIAAARAAIAPHACRSPARGTSLSGVAIA